VPTESLFIDLFRQNWRGGSHNFLKALSEIFFFHWLNPSGPTMVDSASDINEDQRYLLLGKGGRCLRLSTLSPLFANLPEILGPSVSWHPKGRFTHSMPCRWGFRMCVSHLIYTVRPCLIHTCHVMPMPCSDHAVILKATGQHGLQETACGLPASVRLLPATTRSSTKIVIRSIPVLLTTIHTYDCKEW